MNFTYDSILNSYKSSSIIKSNMKTKYLIIKMFILVLFIVVKNVEIILMSNR